MIVTVTPNPSIDRTIEIDRLERGGLNRGGAATSEAAGKGLNVARALIVEGRGALAVLPLARDSAAIFVALLDGEIPIETVEIAGTVRVNLSLVEPDGTVTKVNEPGPALGSADIEAILATAAATSEVGWIVGCGSLPPGAPVDFYGRLARLGTVARRVAIDASGDALAAAIVAGVALVKPNLLELETIAGRPLPTLGDIVAAAGEVIRNGAGAVLVSLGQDGAMFVDASGSASHVEATITNAANSVGAGDALLAGFLASGADAAALPEAVAWSIAAVRSHGTRMHPVTAADRAAVVVHETIDLERRPRP